MKILLVEDNRHMSSEIVRILKPWYVVDPAFTIKESEYLASLNEYDAFVVDIILPDGNGIEFVRHLRADLIYSPILILTGRIEENETVLGLDGGADDYLTKPFRKAELLARLRALLRRTQTSHLSSLRLGDLVLDQSTRTVTRQGRSITLRKKEFSLLEFLIRNKGTVVTRSMFLDHIWESSEDPLSSTIDVHINSLRNKIDRPFGSSLIKTVHGMGYKIEE